MRKVFIVLLFAINSVSYATNYYVKNGGNDSNSGLDDANAWAHHPWMSTWSGHTTLVAGDNVFFKRGDTWSISDPSAPFMTVAQSGSNTNPIKTSSYGTGNKPIIKIVTDSNYPVIRGISKSYVCFDNLEISHFNDVTDDSQTQCGIHITESGGIIPHNWVISNCSIHNIPFIGIFADEDSYNITVGDVSASSCATAFAYSNNIYNCYYGAVVLYGKNISTNRSDFNVYYNYIHDIGSGKYNIDAYGIAFTEGVLSSGWPSYCTARYNRIENIIGWEGIETHGGTYMYFQDNYVYNCAIGIAAFAADRVGYAAAVLNHCYIERNIIEAPGAHPTDFYSGIIVAGENIALRPTDCFITDNTIFYSARPAEISGRAITVQTSDGVIIDGNIIYNGPTGSSQGAIRIGGNTEWKTKNIIVRNNWIHNWDAGINIVFHSIDGNIACYNNIIWSHLRSLVGQYGNFTGDITVFNNVLLSTWSELFDYAIGFDEGSSTTLPVGSSLTIKNNIVGFTSPSSKGVYIRSPGTINGSFTIDYNLYWNSTYTSPYNLQGTSYNWTNWNGHIYDTHSLNNTDPLFKNKSGSYSENLDFVLKSTSPAINKGTVVSEVTSDFYGNRRDTVTPDIGAYEYIVPVTGITVTGAVGSNTITTNKGTLQLISSVLPDNAANKKVAWSIINGTGQASVSSTGLVTAIGNGTVTARSTATDGSGIYGTLLITISNQAIPVTGIVLSGDGGAATINTSNGTLQLTAAVSPSNATNKNCIWSIVNGTGQASISSSGLVTAIANGTVTARATATDGSVVYGILLITISNQVIPVTGIVLSGAGGAVTITTYNGTLQLSAAISPSNATNKTVTWSVTNGTGQATINSAGLVSATANGNVTAIATATDGSGVYSTLFINITNQIVTDSLVPVNSVIENNSPSVLEVDYNITVANVIPSVSAFSVIVNSTTRNINKMTISGTKVLLTLASPVANSDIITFAYNKPSTNPLQATSGGLAASVGPLPVTNKVNSVSYVPQIINIFPNPAQEFINIRITKEKLIPDFIRILNLSGKIVLQHKINQNISELQLPLDLMKGIYIVQMGSGNTTLFTQKLIIVK